MSIMLVELKPRAGNHRRDGRDESAPRNSVIRNSRSFESDDSITTSTSTRQKILKRISGIATVQRPGSARWPGPTA